MTEATLWRNTRVMTVGTALSRVTGLMRVAAMTYALGVTGTRLADTYNLANTMPNVIYDLFLGGILTAVFVPVLVDAQRRESDDASALVSVSLIALAIISTLAAAGAPLVMRIYTFRVADPAARAEQLALATFLLRWFAPQIFFYGLAGVTQALLNVRGRFAGPMFAPVLNNVLVIGTFVAYAQIIGTSGLHLSTAAKTLLGAGTTAGVVLQAVVLLPYLRADRLRFRPEIKNPAIGRMFHLSKYVVAYVALNQAALWVVLAFANGVRGGVTAWLVAYTFFTLPYGLFAVSILTALLPDLSRAAGDADWSVFREWLTTGMRGVAYLLIPAAVGYVIVAGPLARVLLAHGVADASDAAAVATVLRAFAPGLVFFSAFQLLARCFYALPDTRTPTICNAIIVVLQSAANFPLFAWRGVEGLAYAFDISYLVGTMLLWASLYRRVPMAAGAGEIAAPIARICAAAAAMGACVWGLGRVLEGHDVLSLGATVGAGAILYLAFSQVAGVEERTIVLGFIRQRRL